jgi:hypothetical protein
MHAPNSRSAAPRTPLLRRLRTSRGLKAFALATLLPLLAGATAIDRLDERRMLRTIESPPLAATGVTAVGYVPRLSAVARAPDGRLFGIEDHFVYESRDGGASFRQLGALPKADPSPRVQAKDLVARSAPVRLLRNNVGPRAMAVLHSGTLLVFWDKLYRSGDGGRSFEVVFDPAAHGIANPMGVQSVAVGRDDTVYWGEYKVGPRPATVQVMRGTDDGRHWALAYRFAPGEAFHVHSVHYDHYRDRFWVLTGDTDAESRVLYTDDHFASLQTLGGGSQDWRVVTMIITRDALYWGSDDDTERGASIFRYDLGAHWLERQQHIGQVSYSSTVLSDGTLAIGTAYEPDSRFTAAQRPMPGAGIWLSTDGRHWREAVRLPYVPHQTRSGRPARAAIFFPGGPPADRLVYSPLGTAQEHFTVQLRTVDRVALAVR